MKKKKEECISKKIKAINKKAKKHLKIKSVSTSPDKVVKPIL